jgi:hypothetical protein
MGILPPRKGIHMVQRTSYDHSSAVSIPPDKDAANVLRGSLDRELKTQPVEQHKSAAINNWLNSKICGKAC